MMTPYDKFKSIENAKNYLKPDVTFEILGKAALNQTDDQAAEQLQKERSKLFENINERDLKAAELLGFFISFNQTHLSIGKYCANPGFSERKGNINRLHLCQSLERNRHENPIKPRWL
jgi:hypothetical protein